MSSPISVQLDSLDALADELAALAGELADDADLCRRAGGRLCAGLSGDVGLDALAGARGWAGLTAAVADAARSIAVVLASAVTAYRHAEAARARTVLSVHAGFRAVP
jgi:hypothetical protein